MNPSVSFTDIARPRALNGNLPMRISMPFSLACCSPRPAVAISGSVKMAAGIATQSLAAFWPAMTSATTSPSFVALWASIGRLEQSPTA